VKVLKKVKNTKKVRKKKRSPVREHDLRKPSSPSSEKKNRSDSIQLIITNSRQSQSKSRIQPISKVIVAE